MSFRIPQVPARVCYSVHVGHENRSQFLKNKSWPNNFVLKVAFLDEQSPSIYTWADTSFEDRKNWVQHIVALNFNMFGITFDFTNSLAESHIRISFDSNLGAWSYIGTDATYINHLSATMNLGWLDSQAEEGRNDTGAVILHEFGHALGMYHEHQSFKSHYTWNVDVIYDFFLNLLAEDFDAENPSPTESQRRARLSNLIENNITDVVDVYHTEEPESTEFDWYSIMHYRGDPDPDGPKWTTPPFPLSSHDRLTEKDIQGLLNMYPPSSSTPEPVEPQTLNESCQVTSNLRRLITNNCALQEWWYVIINIVFVYLIWRITK